MKLWKEYTFYNFEPWGGAIDTYNKIADSGKQDDFVALVNELDPRGMSETALNDLLWFDCEYVFKCLGMPIGDDA